MVFGLFCRVAPEEEMSLLASLMNVAIKEDIVAFEEPDTVEQRRVRAEQRRPPLKTLLKLSLGLL